MESRNNNEVQSDLCEDVVAEILTRHDARFLRQSMRLVCRPWHRIIAEPWFARAHLKRARPRIIDKSWTYSNRNINDSCDGLLLLIIPAYPDPDCYEILNPITGLRVKLPETTPGHGWGFATPESSILATSSFTGVCKVVHTANTPDDKFFLEIITVGGGGGGGGWRDISGPCAGFRDVSWVRNDGFLHAISRRGFQTHLHSHMYMVSLDVDTETFHEMRLPPCCEKEKYHFLDSRGRRALLADQLSMTEFDVWMSMDDGGIEWTKVYNFNADRRFGGLWNVSSVSAVSGSDDLKRLVLHVEVVEGDGEMGVVWVLCEGDESSVIELSDKRRWSMELKFSMGYPRSVKEHVDSLISWHA